MRQVILLLATVALSSAAAGVADQADSPRAPSLSNERVTAWSVLLTPGVSGPMTAQNEDTVILFLEEGRVRTLDKLGKTSTVERHFGDAVFVPRGADSVDTLVSGGPVREVVIALKEQAATASSNTSGYPTAFPRAGAVKVLDTPRFTVWTYSWTKGVPTGMHFHDKDILAAMRYDSTQSLRTPDGGYRTNEVKAGDLRYLKRGVIHSEAVETDRQSAVILELK